MFTGIIKHVFEVKNIFENQQNRTFEILAEEAFIKKIQVDESIAHDGACLTVEKIDANNLTYFVTAIHETLLKTNLKNWSIGKKINIERSLQMNDLLGGHLVQGHIDTTAVLKDIQPQAGSYQLFFEYSSEWNKFVVAKGSIAINGVSLTVVSDEPNHFSVCIIPYTWENTNLKYLKINDLVNIEFDIIAKYLAKWHQQ